MIKKNISIKGIPMDVYETIKKRAERNHRSMNNEIINLLSNVNENDQLNRYNSVLQNVKELKKDCRGTLSPEEIRAAIEEGRE
jgi:plasmid stability protein